MGKPIDFPESNFTWRGWTEAEGRPAVADLPVWHDRPAGKGQVTRSVSCWKLTWTERLCVLFTGRVWLSVLGRHPAVKVQGDYPFLR